MEVIMREGALTPEQYKTSLEEDIAKGKRLYDLYQKKKAVSLLNYIKIRIETTQKDLHELEEVIETFESQSI